ncbi:carboxypeptidase M32 [Anaerosporobacter sp.]|uniref:carboxypeptidase M32 n=1 Tax=Anaerosporobacter sp. TaxID=1872529 RepID=UPI00286ECB4C|nr:carboxypeptidase M32 [Anaerosporobacter sp.]
MSKLFEELQPILDKDMALNTALTLLDWDNKTLAPEKSIEYTAKVMGILSDEAFRSFVNPEVRAILAKLEEHKEELEDNEKAILKKLLKDYEKMEKIPPEENREFSELEAVAGGIWAKAKNNDNFAEFAPTLEKVIHFQKKFAGYRKKGDEKIYDIVLSDYEECFNTEMLDAFFNKVKEEIVPLIKEVSARRDQIDKSYNALSYDVKKQEEFGKYIAEYVGFDFKKGVLAASEHPFTTNLHNHDVRITTHYYENDLESSIFSVIHEAGHAIYEMQVADELTQTPVGAGTSMGMHESQSRFFENVIGRSEEFWTPLYPKLQETFKEQLADISLEQFIAGINKSVPSLIRTEADELTYTLHIIIRYEMEKMFMENEIDIMKLPELWNQKYEEYLGITPPSDKDGILQDVHWSLGAFGYFPSYALGSAVAAQIYYHIKSIMPFEEYLKEGNLAPIREYLKEHIHRFGMTKNTNEFLMEMMGEELNADYYVRYLKEKYTKVYGL